MQENFTDFGFKQIPKNEKSQLVKEVFHSVAEHYDIMNDLMSFGLHRLWKRHAIRHCALRSGQSVLDLAGGTGDLAKLCHQEVGALGHTVLADINEAMLLAGFKKRLDQGSVSAIKLVEADAEQLPFKNNSFDCVLIGFGLRNMTDKTAALTSVLRALKPGGRLVILEFSHIALKGLEKLYDAYSFHILPRLGQLICQDADSYRYLAESIRKHPPQEVLLDMMHQVGFENCSFHNLTGGVVAIHKGFKF